MRRTATLCEFAMLFWMLGGMLWAQQSGDPRYVPTIRERAFADGTGPSVLIDAAHRNFHTMDGRFKAFADLLHAHGCTVGSAEERASTTLLAGCDIYVIANALAAENAEKWEKPVRNAFDTEEIDILARWVHEGGALLLIADHMPFAGAIDSLALRFSIHFSDGFALYEGRPGRGLMFTRMNDNIRGHWITDTPFDGARIDSVVTFTGSAFQIQRAHDPLLVFGAGMLSLEPVVAWEFDASTPRIRIEGWRQGAAMEYGKGRIVVFGEAAMFTAQRAENGLPIGLNSPEGARNAPLIINIIRWLASRERL
ncbi:MAG: hypothetical protein RBU27_09890 [Bacteroidota bacterium]|jgi:hypothetical protein|nr:hypothetical protein [Bacteroidota bacterium]